ncbi:hypothetical protein [Pseudomonas sp. GZD-209]|uniref:hypothetical protein n=1 Tax=Pseudomonas sp. GZD-209 TaxID=3404807 RepID=UPI003BB59836
MSGEREIDNAALVGESDVDPQYGEFVQNLRELMGWYGKSAKDVMAMLQTEPSLLEVQSSSVSALHSIH